MGTVLVYETFFYTKHNPQFAGQILFGPDVSAGHFQRLSQALSLYSKYTGDISTMLLFGTCKQQIVQTIPQRLYLYSY